MTSQKRKRERENSTEATDKPTQSQIMGEPSALLNYEDLARMTRKSVVTLRRYSMSGIGPKFLRIGRHVRFRTEDVLEWLDSCVGPPRSGTTGRSDSVKSRRAE